jgi:hypothetical protein
MSILDHIHERRIQIGILERRGGTNRTRRGPVRDSTNSPIAFYVKSVNMSSSFSLGVDTSPCGGTRRICLGLGKEHGAHVKGLGVSGRDFARFVVEQASTRFRLRFNAEKDPFYSQLKRRIENAHKDTDNFFLCHGRYACP